MKIFSPDRFFQSFSRLLPYLPFTLGILIISVIISLLFGGLLAWCKLRKNRIASGLANFYSQIIRGTPFIILLFIMYFGLPKLFLSWFGVNIEGISKAVYIVITLSMFGAARMSETLRSAYLSVTSEQMEAAYSCGLSSVQGFLHIVLPQALLVALPNLGNLIISNLLETSVGFSIGVVDFVGNARLIIKRSYGIGSLEIYLVVALTYWILSIAITQGTEALERFLERRQGIQRSKKVGGK